MNGMNFKPFINKVLDSLSDTDIGTFATLINSHSNDFVQNSIGGLTNDDKGVGLYTIQLDEHTIRTGYLIYNNTYCVLLAYVSNSERVTEYEINVTQKTYRVVKEYLTTDYLRQAVAVKAVSAGELGDLVEIKEVTNLPATGEEDTIYLSDTNIVDVTDDTVTVPVSEVADAGKVIQVGSTGEYELGELPPDVENAQSGTIQDVLGLDASGKLVKGAVSGGTKLYMHKIRLTKGDVSEIYIISNSNTEITYNNWNDIIKFEIYDDMAERCVQYSLMAGGGSPICIYFSKLEFTPPDDFTPSIRKYRIDPGDSFTDTVTEL